MIKVKAIMPGYNEQLVILCGIFPLTHSRSAETKEAIGKLKQLVYLTHILNSRMLGCNIDC